MWRKVEGLVRKILPTFSGEELSPQEREGHLKAAHELDVMHADLATTLGVGASTLGQLADEMERLLSDPEIQREWRELFDAKVEELGRGLDGYESFALWAEAGRIVEKQRQSEAISKENPETI